MIISCDVDPNQLQESAIQKLDRSSVKTHSVNNGTAHLVKDKKAVNCCSQSKLTLTKQSGRVVFEH